jgi:hypothetical protein
MKGTGGRNDPNNVCTCELKKKKKEKQGMRGKGVRESNQRD